MTSLWKKALIGCAALAALPLLALGALTAPLYTAWVERRARRGAWEPRRDFSGSPSDEWTFAWMATSEEEARRALGDASASIVQALPVVLDLPSLERLELVNPDTGFAIEESKLRPITDDFAPGLARALDGERGEEVTLVVNGAHRLGLDVDARSFVAGHLTVSLGVPTAAEVVEELRRGYEADQPQPSASSPRPLKRAGLAAVSW